MFANEIRERFMAITESYFRENGYKVTKAKFYKNMNDFRIDVVTTSIEPNFAYAAYATDGNPNTENSSQKLIATPSLDFRILFTSNLCEKLGIVNYDQYGKAIKKPTELSSVLANSCPVRNAQWRISTVEDFDRYRVGIRMRALECITVAESYQEPKLYFESVFGREGGKRRPLGSYDQRKMALYRVGKKYGIDDQEFKRGLALWIDKTRENHRKILYAKNLPPKPLSASVSAKNGKTTDYFADLSIIIARENAHLRKLAKALGQPPEIWTMRNMLAANLN